MALGGGLLPHALSGQWFHVLVLILSEYAGSLLLLTLRKGKVTYIRCVSQRSIRAEAWEKPVKKGARKNLNEG
jgi:hypothetical protein